VDVAANDLNLLGQPPARAYRIAGKASDVMPAPDQFRDEI
jgi:hypothetical protein